MNDQVQEVKDRVDIVDLVSSYLDLKSAGANFRALCPFHKEKTPSFNVNQERQIYKCFGCGEGGDVFEFIQKMEGLNFAEALKMLADKAGITLTQFDSPRYKKEQDTKSNLYKINTLTAKFFHFLLTKHPSGKNALSYVQGRGLNDESIKKFMIGYAPGPAIEPWLTKHGFSLGQIAEAGGLGKFRNRLVFPIYDVLGNVIGFTGRALIDDQVPKYLNTPETKLFHKSKVVYGLNTARQSIRTNNQAIILEGQMDVIMSHQAGVDIAVASSGTALTADHLKIIGRYTPNIIFSFDQDEAGINAAKKAIGLAFELGLNPKIVTLPGGYKDPAEAIIKDPKIWTEAIKKPLSALDWFIKIVVADGAKELDAPTKKRIAAQILPLITRINDPVEQSHYLQALAQKLSVSENALAEAMNRFRAATTSSPQSVNSGQSRGLEEQLVGLCTLHPNFIDELSLDQRHFTNHEHALSLYNLMISCYHKNHSIGARQLIKSIKKELSQLDQVAFDLLLVETEKAIDRVDPKELAQSLAERLKQQYRENLKKNLAEQIAQAEASGNRNRVKTLLKELQSLLI